MRNLEVYVKEMAGVVRVPGPSNFWKIQDDVIKLWHIVKSQALFDDVVRSLSKAAHTLA